MREREMLIAHDIAALESLGERARNAANAIQDWLEGVTVFEWVLLAIAAALIYWVTATVWAATRLGPIDVEPVEDDDAGSKPKAQQRTSLLRERIAAAGFIPPPQIPGGAPHTDLLSAVAESPMPSANWIASLLKLVPQPRPTGYRLKATVAQRSSVSAEASIWLRPSNRTAPPLLRTFEARTVDGALELVPAAVFMHVSNDAVHVFPFWARWQSDDALRHYFGGIFAADHGQREAARSAFRAAEAGQPTNALVRLRLANLQEHDAAADDNGVPSWMATATALRMYLNLAAERPELVEARYRASVLATRIVDQLQDLSAAERDVLLATLEMETIDHVRISGTLTRIASLELDRAIAMVRPWFALVAWRRLRYAVEAKGYERRRLRATLLLARHSRYVRGLAAFDYRAAKKGDPRHVKTQIWLRTLRVWALAGRPTAGWQARYGAASFFALLDARRARVKALEQELRIMGDI
jgi:hypothetical protein